MRHWHVTWVGLGVMQDEVYTTRLELHEALHLLHRLEPSIQTVVYECPLGADCMAWSGVDAEKE